ncbi:MAG: MBL fold metallo-hydrolase [Deltaproteobacteria bacterium]|nr:MBL fold metallo-hydrolase [Deltaproteobacteria bacterium]
MVARLLVLVFVALIPSLSIADEADKERVSELLTRGERLERAVRVHERIWLASGNSNAYLVTTPAGNVLIDTGATFDAERTRRALDAVPGEIRAVVLTHAHVDHVGGMPLLAPKGVPVIAHRAMRQRLADQIALTPFRNKRARVLWSAVMDGQEAHPVADVAPSVIVDDAHELELGGTRFVVLATPGGEGPDGLTVWIPELGAIFTGDLCGPTTASFPNLFTLRGENLREAVPMIASLDRVLAISPRPRLWLPGHFEPVRGRKQIRSTLQRTRDAVAYVHAATVSGMNAGKDLWTLMREVKLPPELAVSEQYGRVAWGVRAICESYTGWFRYESTAELYATPRSVADAELVALAGGASAVAARAQQHVARGEPELALHFVDAALAADAKSRDALAAKRAALEALLARDGANFQLGGWLRHELRAVEALLAH